jgi:GntR family transcriptional regulator
MNWKTMRGADAAVSGDGTQKTLPESLPAAISSMVLDRTSPVPLYQQLCENLRGAIASGDLWPGLLLPTTYKLAAALGVARKTVVAAYSRLAAEGLLISNTRRGTRVAPTSFADKMPASEVDSTRIASHLNETEVQQISYRARQLLDTTDAADTSKSVQSPDP